MRGRLVWLAVGCAVGSTFLLTGPAAADDGAGAFVDEKGDPTAVATDREPAVGKSPGVGAEKCVWKVLIKDDFEWALYDLEGNRRYSVTGRWLALDCPAYAPGTVGGIVIVPERGPVDVAALNLDALARAVIDEPEIATSPPPDRRLYTQVPTWLWLDPVWWRSYSATATAGRVTSTVTATPVEVEWEPGDGSVVSCRGPGVPWQRGLPDTATYCSHTYRHSSAGQEGDAFTLGATVRFEITWTSNTGQSGSLVPVARTASRSVQVGEIQAIETE